MTEPPADEPVSTPAPEEPAASETPVEAPLEAAAPEPGPAAQAVTGRLPEPEEPAPAARPGGVEPREPVYRECGGFRLRLEPPDLARLRELPGSRGKSDSELGEAFFDGQADRIAASVAGDVSPPAELRVVVDPYSRQAFVALENSIRGIFSF